MSLAMWGGSNTDTCKHQFQGALGVSKEVKYKLHLGLQFWEVFGGSDLNFIVSRDYAGDYWMVTGAYSY